MKSRPYILIMIGLTGSLRIVILCLALLACAAPLPKRGLEPQGPGAVIWLESLELQVHELVNAHRQSVGLAPLNYSARVAEIARRHSEDMATGRVPVGHEGFEARAREAAQTIHLSAISENVGVNNYREWVTPRTAVFGWLGSRGHRKNIEGAYDLTGVGIVRDPLGMYYYTQLFIKTSEVSTNSPAPAD